jgi:hypothetical protein
MNARSTISVTASLLISVMLLWFALLPTHPSRNRDALEAYSRYLRAPSEETRQTYQNILDRVNRPFHISQYLSGVIGLSLLLRLVVILGKHRTTSMGGKPLPSDELPPGNQPSA